MPGEKHIVIVGATGVVGNKIREILAERTFPVSRLSLLASSASVGKFLEFHGDVVSVEDLSTFDFSGVDIAFFSAGSGLSKKYAEEAAIKGAIVIDNTSCFRYDDGVPLVVPEVNPQALEGFGTSGIIANPNCSTAGLVVALKPIYDRFGITRLNVTTFQSVSGSGKAASDELLAQTGQIVAGEAIDAPSVYPQQIAFNVIPHIDTFQENGYTREEMKVVWEIQKILGDENIQVSVTAVRVPVMVAHSMAVNIETHHAFDLQEAVSLMRAFDGLVVMSEDAPNGYPTPINPAAGADPVYVGRIRRDISHQNALNCWVVADNLRKGAALNAVQIAELLR